MRNGCLAMAALQPEKAVGSLTTLS